MRIVLKYPFEIKSDITIDMPVRSKIVLVELQVDQPTIWAEVELGDNAVVPKRFAIIETGHIVPPGGMHVASFQEDIYVWHLYAIEESMS